MQVANTDAATVNFFVDWLYTRQLPKHLNDWRGIQKLNDATPGQERLGMIKALAFANRIMAPGFQRAINAAIVDCHIPIQTPYYEAVIFAFANLPPNDPILTLLVELQYRGYTQDSDTHENGEIERQALLPHEFLLRVMLRLGKSVGNRGIIPLSACDYHGHATDEERMTCEHK